MIQFEGKNEWYGCCSRVNEFTLACLELFHMKPGGVHSRHLPAPHLRHGMLVSATNRVNTFNTLEHNLFIQD